MTWKVEKGEGFQRKPELVQAIQWSGDNAEEMKKFLEGYEHGPINNFCTISIKIKRNFIDLQISDFLAINERGELYPYSAVAFHRNFVKEEL